LQSDIIGENKTLDKGKYTLVIINRGFDADGNKLIEVKVN
jgi:hypothetical protein